VNEDALRALVRDTIARLSTQAPASTSAPDPHALINLAAHPSHYQYNLTPSDGPCFIEPGVPCNHCGYCQTHGH
jgi:hypothetical protein